MDNEKKNSLSATINLPIQSVLSIIDNDDVNVDVSVNRAIDKIKSSNSSIRSLNTRVFIDIERQSAMGRTFDPLSVKLTHEDCTITKISKRPIEKTNDIKFFNVRLEFSTGNEKKFILPSYVKFYSSRRGMFIPVEFIRNRDILLDYTGNIVKVDDVEQITDVKLTEFYSIHTLYSIINNQFAEDNIKILNEYNFYLNGILTSISYNNFQKRED